METKVYSRSAKFLRSEEPSKPGLHRFRFVTNNYVRQDGLALDVNGANLERFKRFILSHNAKGIPETLLGNIINPHVVGDAIEGEVEYVGPDINPRAQQVKAAYDQGFLEDVSVTFEVMKGGLREPTKDEAKRMGITDPWGLVCNKFDVLEGSAVLFGADQDAVKVGRARGFDFLEVAGSVPRETFEEILDRKLEELHTRYGDAIKGIEDRLPTLIEECVRRAGKPAQESTEASQGEASPSTLDPFIEKLMAARNRVLSSP